MVITEVDMRLICVFWALRALLRRKRMVLLIMPAFEDFISLRALPLRFFCFSLILSGVGGAGVATLAAMLLERG